jgi:hypothetical protein
MDVGSKLTERSRANDVKRLVSDVLTFNAFTPLVDAWNRDPDPTKVSWKKLDLWLTSERLGHASVEECQAAIDKQRSQAQLLTVCGETCVVKNEVIDELKLILGR